MKGTYAYDRRAQEVPLLNLFWEQKVLRLLREMQMFIMNLCKQNRLDAWAIFGLPLHSLHFQKIKYIVFLKATSCTYY